MVEAKTYEEIMEAYYKKLPEGIDSREGTLAYILGSAMGIRLAEMYEDLKIIENNCYCDTATGEVLEKAVKLVGIERRGKTNAVVRMEGDKNFCVGDVFLGGGYEYVITACEDEYYLAQCKTKGVAPNAYLGEVLPKGDTLGFAGMSIVSVVANGEDVEDDKSLRGRFLDIINCPVCTGNMSYYKEAIHTISGVGGIKVVPVSEGRGTVKVIITDEAYDVATEDLISYVKSVLDPEETSGQGYGLVPIGHRVEVETVEKVDVSIEVEVLNKAGEDAVGYYRQARAKLPEIFKEINETWDKNDNIVLMDRVIEDYFYSLGARDVNVISMNGSANRLILNENQILGGVLVNGA